VCHVGGVTRGEEYRIGQASRRCWTVQSQAGIRLRKRMANDVNGRGQGCWTRVMVALSEGIHREHSEAPINSCEVFSAFGRFQIGCRYCTYNTHTKAAGLIINRAQNNEDRTSSRSSHGGRCGCLVVVWWWCGLLGGLWGSRFC
jgi:hypothetical protein